MMASHKRAETKHSSRRPFLGNEPTLKRQLTGEAPSTTMGAVFAISIAT